MGKDKVSDESEQIVIYPADMVIEVRNANPKMAYGLFENDTGTQVTNFVKAAKGRVEFTDLNPRRCYDVGVVKYLDEVKPQFCILWNDYMAINKNAKLNSCNKMPVEYPYNYRVKYLSKNYDGVLDLVDDKNEPVGLTIKTTSGNKARLIEVHSFIKKDKRRYNAFLRQGLQEDTTSRK